MKFYRSHMTGIQHQPSANNNGLVLLRTKDWSKILLCNHVLNSKYVIVASDSFGFIILRIGILLFVIVPILDFVLPVKHGAVSILSGSCGSRETGFAHSFAPSPPLLWLQDLFQKSYGRGRTPLHKLRKSQRAPSEFSREIHPQLDRDSWICPLLSMYPLFSEIPLPGKLTSPKVSEKKSLFSPQ